MSPPAEGPSPGSGVALIIEESIIVALEVETLLRDVGIAPCFLVRTVGEALSILDSRSTGFAIIDVDLGHEAAADMATTLQERMVPFLFSARYGEAGPLRARFPEVPVLAKPLRAADLYRSLARIGVLEDPGSPSPIRA